MQRLLLFILFLSTTWIARGNDETLRWRYWFDNMTDDYTVMPSTTTSYLIDVSALEDGLHSVCFQAIDENFSNVVKKFFVKVSNDVEQETYCIIHIDEQFFSKEAITVGNGGIVPLNIDVKELSQGLHKIELQVMDTSGAVSASYKSFFVKDHDQESQLPLRCLYLIDDADEIHETAYSEGMSNIDIDVEHLEEGPHSIRWMLADEKGAYLSDNRSWFFKKPLGENGIKEFTYWLNDDYSNKYDIVLEEPANPYDVISLLPVKTMPLRSNCFHFEVKDGNPKVYAKNDIHFTFSDKFSREVSVEKQFIDYNVSEDITDLSVLSSRQTFSCPDTNRIKWFCFEAAPGDTIAFKASQATSLQVFSPSGKELYAALGDKSVKYGGVHTWEEGVHYLAVHDVTGSKSDLTLDYVHLDKYDVVAQNVKVVGNGGCSTITFKGNGFRDLYDVELTADTDEGKIVLHPVYIDHISDSEVSVTFDFSQVPLNYNPGITGAGTAEHPIYTPGPHWEKTIGSMNFLFTQGVKTLPNSITIEEPKDITLSTKVSYPSLFVRGSSVTYTIEITNNGNMTAYTVPVETKVIVDNFNDINSIKFSGDLKTMSISDLLMEESFDQDEIGMITTALQAADDRCQFIIVNDSVNHMDYGFAHIFTTIAPNTTQKLIITISSNSSVLLKAFTAKDWFPVLAADYAPKKARSLKVASGNSLCCMKQQFQCAADIIAFFGEKLGEAIPGVAGGNINCGTKIATTTVSLAFDIGCSEGDNLNERMKNYAQSQASSLASKLIDALVSCVTGYYKPILASLRASKKIALDIGNISEVNRINSQIVRVREVLNGTLVRIYKGVKTAQSGKGCLQLIADPTPDCPPNPEGGGGIAVPYSPGDPNDIYGYISESGSKFINAEVRDLNYRIEFENDPEFATASAHVVEIRDTLDTRFFDLSTFKPTSFRIGDKIEYLDGTANFVKTIDMRPAINAIAQVEGSLDEEKGIARWLFTSLDPMTMEPTDDIMQGFLPINNDGTSGVGEVTFDIALKEAFPDGTEISNRASIVFDNEAPIETPLWTNTIDAVAPTGHVVSAKQKDYETATLKVEGTDKRSGVWAYDVYVQYGTKAEWLKVAEKVSPREDGTIDIKVYESINHGFYVCAIDSAGNVEGKEPFSEARLDLSNVISGDANGDGKVSVSDMTTIISALKGDAPEDFDANGADANHDGVLSLEDLQAIIRRILRK